MHPNIITRNDIMPMADYEQVRKAKRAEMMCEMQTLIHNNSGMIIPNHLAYVDAKRSNVKGVGKSPLGSLGAYEWPEFAWLDS